MLVVVFDNETKAYEGKSALRQLEREGSIAAYAGAVVVKNADGTTSVKQFDDFGPAGSLVGTSVGSLIGLIGGPVGLAVGAASGLALGAIFDLENARVGTDFVDDVSKSLKPTSRRTGRRPSTPGWKRWAGPCFAARCPMWRRTSGRRTSPR
jgi:uncharacterized membrane protein